MLARPIILAAIRAYQRYVSPYKGFCCAYRHHTGRASCSALGFRAVRRYGVIAGLSVLRARMKLCGLAYRRNTPARPLPLFSQRGECDLSCDMPCDSGWDLPSGSGISRLCDLASYCDCGSCDWPERKRKNKEREEHVYLPPNPRLKNTTGNGSGVVD